MLVRWCVLCSLAGGDKSPLIWLEQVKSCPQFPLQEQFSRGCICGGMRGSPVGEQNSDKRWLRGDHLSVQLAWHV